LEKARRQVAALLGAAVDEIVFASGGSEANNLALKGTFFALKDNGEHIITTQVEHPAIVEPSRFLERLGATGVVREKSIALPERESRVSSPLIPGDFSGSIRAVRRPPQVFKICSDTAAGAASVVG